MSTERHPYVNAAKLASAITTACFDSLRGTTPDMVPKNLHSRVVEFVADFEEAVETNVAEAQT